MVHNDSRSRSHSFAITVLVIGWLGLLYTRTQAHVQVMSPTWIVFLVLAHSLSVTIGWMLRGIRDKR